jgi:23S rRNA (guanosine2251-2'-O)-methyltransferase
MRQFLDRAKEAGARLIEADSVRIAKLAGSHGHQGVAARVEPVAADHLARRTAGEPGSRGIEQPLLLVLDGVTDPHNLGACLRVADGAGAHAVIAPKDHAVGINATVAKVASGAAETMPYFMVTNLARTLNELKERNIWMHWHQRRRAQDRLPGRPERPVALVLGAEGDGMRQLTRKTCDELVSHPDEGRGREPERFGGQRRVPVRGAAPARLRRIAPNAATACAQASSGSARCCRPARWLLRKWRRKTAN